MRLSENIQKQSIQLYNHGYSPTYIAKKLHIGRGSVSNIMKYHHLPMRKIGAHKKIHSFNEDFFNKIDTEKKAYWLGFIYADGYISNHTLGIGLAIKDKNHLKKFKKDILSTHPISVGNNNGYPSCLIRIYSHKIFAQLQNLGCYERKSLTLKFPSYDIIPENLIHHFMRGYFDGDGSIYFNGNKHPSLTFNVVSSEFFIRKYLEILNEKTKLNKTTITRNSKSPIFSFAYSGNFNLTKIYKFLYYHSNIALDRKVDIFKHLEFTNFTSPKQEQECQVLDIIKKHNGKLSSRQISDISAIKFTRLRFILKSLCQSKKCYWIRQKNGINHCIYYA